MIIHKGDPIRWTVLSKKFENPCITGNYSKQKNWHTSLKTTKRTHKLMCMNSTLKYNHIAFYFSRNYGCTLDTELNRLSFSSYFDKSHLELWRKKQVLIQGAPNLSHCLKSWKKYLTKGVIQYNFLHLSAELNQSFFSSKKWVMTAVRQMRFVTETLALSLLSSPLASFSTWIDFQAPGYWHRGMRTVSFKCTRNPTHGTVTKQLPHTIEHYMKAWAKVLSVHSKPKQHIINCDSPYVVRLKHICRNTTIQMLDISKLFTWVHGIHWEQL